MRRLQLFVSNLAPSQEYMRPVINSPLGDTSYIRINKPSCGLWTSTRLDVGRSAWTDWLASEMPEWLEEKPRTWAMEIKPKDVRLFVVTSHEDIARLPRNMDAPRYAWPRQGITPIPTIDFEALSGEYDGLRIINPNIGYTLFREWSIESTLWFRWCFRSVWEEPLDPNAVKKAAERMAAQRQ